MASTHSPSSAARWTCRRCPDFGWDERPTYCLRCGQSDALLLLPVAVRGRAVEVGPRPRVGVVPARDLKPDDTLAPYGQPWESWRFGGRHSVLAYGAPGSGKSSLVTRMAVSAARRIDVLYVAAEEGHSVALRERLARAGLDDLSARRLRVSDARDLAELAEDLGDGVQLVVIDSVSELGVSPVALVQVLGQRSWLAVQHLNARGGAHGGHEWSHAVDAVVRVEDGVATPAKNRFGPMHSINVFADEREVTDARPRS